MAELNVRRYNKPDQETVRDLYIMGLKQNNAYIGGDWDNDLGNIEEVYLKNGDFIVGELNNKIVAMGAFKKISDNRAEIKRIRIHPDYQRKGFGQTILDELEKRASKLGYKILQLDTTDKQIPAQKFFEKNDYVKTKTERLEKHGLDIIYYEKRLK